MDCKESQNLMSAYLDEELDPSATVAFAAHLVSCQACNSAYVRQRDLRAAVRSHAMQHTAPERLRLRILSDLAANKPQPKQRKTSDGFDAWRTWPWARINFGVASLASVLFAVTLVLYMQAPSETDLLDQEIVATHFRSLQANHLADVASSDQHTVKPWFTGKLDYSPPVIDLAQEGFPLIGGRLDYVDRRSVAGLAYRHDKHLINLFVWPDKAGIGTSADRETSGKMTAMHGFQLLRWSQGGMLFTAVSDMNPHELLEFRQLLIAEIDKETKTP